MMGWGHGMMGWGHGMMGWGHGMMRWGNGMMGACFRIIIPLILIGAIVYAVVRLSGHKHTSPNHGRDYDNSIDILNERFAKGEISEEEYKQKKALIMKR